MRYRRQRSTFGTMRLIRTNGNTLEGPSTSSNYVKGQESGNTFHGRASLDTGSYYVGNIVMSYSQEGRCLKGTVTYDDGDVDEIIGYRMKYQGIPYGEIYELTDRTEHLKELIHRQDYRDRQADQNPARRRPRLPSR